MQRLALFILMSGFALAAQAHYLWIERDDAGAKIYFGEWQEDLRENDGGPMKAIQGLKVYGPDGGAIAFERKADHFTVPAAPVNKDLYAYDEVMHRSSKVIYDIKDGRNGSKFVGGFELVPDAANSNALTLMLDGKPLPKAEVKVFGPPKWEKHYTTDDKGRLSIETPWKGYYVLRASYDDETSGEFEGKPFDKIINVMILSFTVKQGLEWKAP